MFIHRPQFPTSPPDEAAAAATVFDDGDLVTVPERKAVKTCRRAAERRTLTRPACFVSDDAP
jgi:hypothetical protein